MEDENKQLITKTNKKSNLYFFYFVFGFLENILIEISALNKIIES